MSKKTLVLNEEFFRKADAMRNEYVSKATPSQKHKELAGKFKMFGKLASDCGMAYGISNEPPNVEITMQGAYLEANRFLNPELKRAMDELVTNADSIMFEALTSGELLMTAVFCKMFDMPEK